MTSRSILCLVFMPLVVACASAPSPKPYDSDNTVAAYDAQNASLARQLFGLKFDASARTESKVNFSAIHTNDLLFSRRIDSRTYFVYDKRASPSGATPYGGGDDRLLQLATTLLKRAGVPAIEIARPRVLREEQGLATMDPRTKAVTNVKRTHGKSIALVSRQIDGVPVFSSRLLLTASAEDRPVFVELHWPEIPPTVVAEARRLQRLVRGGWNAPEKKGARVETVEAGIVHSPAAATVMDITPVIRVVYGSTTPQVGMKAMLYFDRNGEMVTPPREFSETGASCPTKPRAKGDKE